MATNDAKEDTTKGTTLVVGGTGKTGRRVADRLAARGLPVRIGSRSARPSFDWDDEATWSPALEGVSSAYVSYYPDLAVPSAAEKVGAFARLAVGQGTRRLVLLSGRGEPGAQRGEEAIRGSGADWTILRCSWFDQNFSEGAFRDAVMAGHVALPAGSVKEPFVDADDIADAAIVALTEPGHAGQLYELTGPRLLTFAEAVAEIGRALGRGISYVGVPMQAYKETLAAYQVPPDVVWLIEHLFTEVLDGRNAQLADGVQRILGRPARDFGDYARDAAAAGAWAPSPAGDGGRA
jgi:uncharacterized protein YbjT (DUF2867 family)